MRLRFGEQVPCVGSGPIFDSELVLERLAVGFKHHPRERTFGGGHAARSLDGLGYPLTPLFGNILPDNRVIEYADRPFILRR
jgi:hypothetical protein